MNTQKLFNQDQLLQQDRDANKEHVANMESNNNVFSDTNNNDSSTTQDSSGLISHYDNGADQLGENAANDGNDPSTAFNNKTFPEILAEILSTPRNQRSIAWLPHGKSFMILDRQLFVTDILPNYLGKSTKYTSFTRKLSRWKFQRVQDGPEEGAWIHENFVREDLSGMIQMKCAKRKKPMKREMDYPRSMPLKKRPIDPSLFSSKSKASRVGHMENQRRTQQQQHSMPIPCHLQPQLQQSQTTRTVPPGVQTVVSDPTTDSIVSAAVKVLLQSNQTDAMQPPSHHQQQCRQRPLGVPNLNGTSSNPIDLLQALQAARAIPRNHNSSDTMAALRIQHYIQQLQQRQQQKQQQPSHRSN